MLFSYQAKLKTGEVSKGLSEAVDRFSVARDLRSRGYVPLSVREHGGRLMNKIEIFSNIFAKVSISEQMILTKNLSGMLKAGLSMSRALSVLQKQTKNPKLNKILASLANDITAGGTFSEGLAKFPDVFSTLFVSMAKAGEESGNLSGALLDIGVSLEKSHALNKKITGALIYPGIIFSAMIIIGVLMFAFVVPTLAGTFKDLGVVLPLSTRMLVFLGEFFSNNLMLTFLLIFSFGLGIFLLFKAKFMGKYIDIVLIKMPIIGNLTKELNTARTTRTMSSLLSAGVSITRATEITQDVVQNYYYKKILREVRVSIEKGSSFFQIFEAHPDFYPVMMSEMIQVGEETGKLSDMLLQVALFYEEEIENATKNLSIIIEPFLMILIGTAVGFFAISMISPLYSILGNIN